MSGKETIAVYDEKAAYYAENYGSTKPGKHLRAFMAEVTPGGPVLDLGCGPGDSAALMAKAGFVAEAWDASSEMVRFAGMADGVTARQAVFEDLTAEAEFDGIWANFSLLHAPRASMDAHLAAIAKALKPGGIFHIGMKVAVEADDERDQIGRQYTFYSVEDLRARLTAAGLHPFQQDEGEQEGMAGNVEPWVTLLSRKDG